MDMWDESNGATKHSICWSRLEKVRQLGWNVHLAQAIWRAWQRLKTDSGTRHRLARINHIIILATACRCKNVQCLCLWPAISTVMRHLLLRSFPQESVNYRRMMTGGKRRRRRWRGEARGRWQELNRNREREAEGYARDKCSSELSRPPLVGFSFHPDLSVHFPPERASAITQSPRLYVLQHRAEEGFMVGNVLRLAAQSCWTSTWFVKLLTTVFWTVFCFLLDAVS